MGCSESAEDKMYLTKLSRLEVQVAKEKELEKLAKLEGKKVSELNYLGLSKAKADDNSPESTQPKSVIKGTAKTKKKKRNKSQNKPIKKKKLFKGTKDDNNIKKKKRAKSEVNNKKKKKKKK